MESSHSLRAELAARDNQTSAHRDSCGHGMSLESSRLSGAEIAGHSHQGLVTEAVSFSFRKPFRHQMPIWTHIELVSEVPDSS